MNLPDRLPMRADDNYVECRDGTKVHERWICHCSECESHPKGPLMGEERYSLGIYAGKYCDSAWKRSGYRDEGAEGFDRADAGEAYESGDY